ncbi:unnamed protein product [Oncorhynchus mykiss]|uniref:PDEase domain-containing protein n=1 Tax=Oncorhynchus mykiss TaxID=8022 RepID=A0A060X6T8_ONCMY|nr:unnamed protein product [Oncorhynchus mykiss]
MEKRRSNIMFLSPSPPFLSKTLLRTPGLLPVACPTYVSKEGLICNIMNAAQDDFFSKGPVDTSGLTIKKVLLLPSSFRWSVRNTDAYDKWNKPENRKDIFQDMVLYHIKCRTDETQNVLVGKVKLFTHSLHNALCFPVSIQSEVLPPSTKSEIFEFHFCDFEHNHLDLVKLGIKMYYELGVVDKFHVPRETITRFCYSLSKGYRRITYHNWSRGFNVGQTMFTLLMTGDLKRYYTDLETMTMANSRLMPRYRPQRHKQPLPGEVWKTSCQAPRLLHLGETPSGDWEDPAERSFCLPNGALSVHSALVLTRAHRAPVKSSALSCHTSDGHRHHRHRPRSLLQENNHVPKDGGQIEDLRELG